MKKNLPFPPLSLSLIYFSSFDACFDVMAFLRDDKLELHFNSSARQIHLDILATIPTQMSQMLQVPTASQCITIVHIRLEFD